MQIELSKQEADALLRALSDKCADLGKSGDTEAAELLNGVRESLARARRRGEKLQMELSENEIYWVRTAVREKRIEHKKQGKDRAAELLYGIIQRIGGS